MYKGYSSEYMQMHKGVPQGTVLGPWLWLSYINDLKISATLHKYADDLTAHQRIKKDVESEILLDPKARHIELKQEHEKIQKSYDDVIVEWCAKKQHGHLT